MALFLSILCHYELWRKDTKRLTNKTKQKDRLLGLQKIQAHLSLQMDDH